MLHPWQTRLMQLIKPPDVMEKFASPYPRKVVDRYSSNQLTLGISRSSRITMIKKVRFSGIANKVFHLYFHKTVSDGCGGWSWGGSLTWQPESSRIEERATRSALVCTRNTNGQIPSERPRQAHNSGH